MQKISSRKRPRQSDAATVAPYVDVLTSFLHRQHYSTESIRQHRYAICAFGRWLAAHQTPLAEVNEATVATYLIDCRRRCLGKSAVRKAAAALPHLLSVLRAEAACPPTTPLTPLSGARQWLAEFDRHLSQTLGLAVASRQRYCLFVRRFLDGFCGDTVPDWSKLRANHLAAFVRQEAARRQRNARNAPITAIRALLRYLVSQGEIRDGLHAAIPTIRQWKHASLPKRLSTDEIERIVTAARKHASQGLRNHAVVLLLARLGLRAAEVMTLSLDDIDWTDGYLLIRAGKSRRERRLPLSPEVGAALYAYLKEDRPKSSLRFVFRHDRAPFDRFQDSSSIGKIVRQAMRTAGITNAPGAAHLLRHSAASRMVCEGASFKEVADILGHASLDTTAIYAKLDLESLSRVALPWPEVAP